MKQIIKSDHEMPQHDKKKMSDNLFTTLLMHYGHVMRICKYCGWYRHESYVCNCGVDTGYLVDEYGKTIQPLVEVFEVPE
jgi:hypothetical protein